MSILLLNGHLPQFSFCSNITAWKLLESSKPGLAGPLQHGSHPGSGHPCIWSCIKVTRTHIKNNTQQDHAAAQASDYLPSFRLNPGQNLSVKIITYLIVALDIRNSTGSPLQLSCWGIQAKVWTATENWEHMVCTKHINVPSDPTGQYIGLSSSHFVTLTQTNFSVAKPKDTGSLQSNGEGTCERSTSLSVEQGRTR